MTTSSPAGADQLPALLQVHYRLRFDPSGLPERDREQFRTRVNEWLERQEAAIATASKPRTNGS